MGKSIRDKDYHFLRNSEKYMGNWDKYPSMRHLNDPKPNTKENSEKAIKFDKVWSKYGKKSMVSNKRRRNSTRKANQNFKKKLERHARAKRKEEVYQEVNGIKEIGLKFKDTLQRYN